MLSLPAGARREPWAWWAILFTGASLADWVITHAGMTRTLEFREMNPLAAWMWQDPRVALLAKLTATTLCLLLVFHVPQSRRRFLPVVAVFFVLVDVLGLLALWYWWHP